jgi:hypothetical protein
VLRLWALGLPKGLGRIRNQSSSLLAEGDTIYSYGYHHPICRRVALPGSVAYLLNPARYSVTTSIHTADTRRAIPTGCDVFDLPYTHGDGDDLWDALAARNSGPIANYYQYQIDKAARAAVRPGIRAATRARFLDQIKTIYAEWRRLHALFGLRCDPARVVYPNTLEEAREHVRRDDRRVNIARALAQARYLRNLRKESERLALSCAAPATEPAPALT